MSKILQALHAVERGSPEAANNFLFKEFGGDKHPRSPASLEPPGNVAPDKLDQRSDPKLGADKLVFKNIRSEPLNVNFSVADTDTDSRAAEQYRFIRTKIIRHHKTLSMIAMCSPGVGDGKTVTATNLSAILALKSDERILLIDGDFRRSSVHTRFGIAKSPGLADVLRDDVSIEAAMVRSQQFPNLYVLPAGQAEASPTELLESSRWHSLVACVRQNFHRVIVDSPPVDWVADFDLIEADCDGVLMVVRQDYTQRALLRNAMKRVREKCIGVVVNSAEDWFLWNPYPASYYYGQEISRSKSAKH